MEQPIPSEQKKAGLEKKVAEHEAQLAEVEAGLVAMEPVLKVKAGMASASVVFENLRVPEDRDAALNDVREKLRELGASLDAFLGGDYEELLARQRELRQLVQQAKIDSAE